MRVIEPHQFDQIRKKRAKRRLPYAALALPVVLLIMAGGYILFGQKLVNPGNDTSSQVDSASVEPETTEQKPVEKPVLQTFTDEEFKELYSTFAYPNTQSLTESPKITGDKVADERIRTIARERGYQLSSVPVASIVKIDEPYLTDDDLLQPNAKLGWESLKLAADKAEVPLQITSAYRSIDFQRSLFLRILADEGITDSGIAQGYSDVALQRVMNRVAPPGYSRHHNGYTVDFACNGIGLYGFKNTSCYDWISKDNFKIAKEHGWVPSYPEEAELQGPEPEPWEFIWVGTVNLFR